MQKHEVVEKDLDLLLYSESDWHRKLPGRNSEIPIDDFDILKRKKGQEN